MDSCCGEQLFNNKSWRVSQNYRSKYFSKPLNECLSFMINPVKASGVSSRNTGLGSQNQTSKLKIIKINSPKNRRMTALALFEHYFELFRLQNTQKIVGYVPVMISQRGVSNEFQVGHALRKPESQTVSRIPLIFTVTMNHLLHNYLLKFLSY